MVVALADRWHKLPEEIEGMDASNLALLRILKLGRREEPDGE